MDSDADAPPPPLGTGPSPRQYHMNQGLLERSGGVQVRREACAGVCTVMFRFICNTIICVITPPSERMTRLSIGFGFVQETIRLGFVSAFGKESGQGDAEMQEALIGAALQFSYHKGNAAIMVNGAHLQLLVVLWVAELQLASLLSAFVLLGKCGVVAPV